MQTVPLSSVQLTRILRDWSSGDDSALERLTPIVYAELHRLARRNLARGQAHKLLQPSALVNEAFVRSDAGPACRVEQPGTFFCAFLTADAADSGGFRACATCGETGSRQARHVFEHGRFRDGATHSSGYSGSGRGAGGTCGAGCAASPRGRATLFWWAGKQ